MVYKEVPYSNLGFGHWPELWTSSTVLSGNCLRSLRAEVMLNSKFFLTRDTRDGTGDLIYKKHSSITETWPNWDNVPDITPAMQILKKVTKHAVIRTEKEQRLKQPVSNGRICSKVNQ